MSLSAVKYIDAQGFDLFDLFEPWQSGDAHAAVTGLQADSGGGVFVDINQLFAPLAVGSQIDHDTMFELGDGTNTDLRLVFAKKGSRAGTPLSATVPATLNAYTSVSGGTATAHPTCEPAGGTPPYSYLWEIVSGTGTLTSPNSQTCNVAEAVPGVGSIQTTVKCTVTDSVPNSAVSGNCVITFAYHSGAGGGGGGCPMLGMEALLEDGRVKLVERLLHTDLLAAWDKGIRLPGGARLRYAPVITMQPCVLLATPFGKAGFSASTPFDLRTGESRLAPDMHGCEVLHHRLHGDFWDRVTNIELLPGTHAAVRIGIGGKSFATRKPGTHVWLVSHNSGKF